ncbi:hypothetical protein ASZ90_015207 [hydrocarbon metagenome]|uniref:Uncharacterized protein n=1 Tax=hydrocarbon metagenome TaxID=938273 RepID=A0A0W8F2P6_9ZZZZ
MNRMPKTPGCIPTKQGIMNNSPHCVTGVMREISFRMAGINRY